jgi:ERCC4-type nuclease
LDNYDNEEDDFNRFIPTEFLKKLPGIDSNNIIEVTKKVRNMTELCEISEDKLKQIIGPKNARELKNFLESKIELNKDYNNGDY